MSFGKFLPSSGTWRCYPTIAWRRTIFPLRLSASVPKSPLMQGVIRQMDRFLSRVRNLLIVFAVVSIFGCSDNEVICTSEARSSLTITVSDVNGMELSDYGLSYTLDGEPKDEFCLGISCDPVPFEIGGNFTVTASKPGYKSKTIAVTVGYGDCHVITERIEFILEREN